MNVSPDDSSPLTNLPPPPLRVIYSGRVQGVGFRWTCQSIAGRHTVTGTVRNRSDGTVELCVDGDGSTVKAFLAEVQQAMQGNIERVDIEPDDQNSGFPDFRILR